MIVPAASRLHLRREVALWRDRHRAYKIVLDGRVAGQVRQGQSFTTEVTPGAHTLAIKIDWSGSQNLRFSLSPGETAHFVCGPAGKATSALFDLFGRGNWVALSQVNPEL